MPPDAEEMVYVRLSFAWSILLELLEEGVPAPVTLTERVTAIHAMVFAVWEHRCLEFLDSYGKTGARDEMGNSMN